MADKIPQGLSCGLCLEADEPGSMFAVPIQRRFAEAAENIPICVDCATAIMVVSGLELPVEPEDKPDQPSAWDEGVSKASERCTVGAALSGDDKLIETHVEADGGYAPDKERPKGR